ncbi:MAG: hypothetical protein GEU74_12200 [Nitriliruptorales bacterium]|nr:hypothetical protein [Nitriliruptorales bacterium]
MTPPAGTATAPDVESRTRRPGGVANDGDGVTTTPTQATASGSPEAVPVAAEGLQLLGAFAGSGYEQAPSLVRRADGQTLQLTPLLYTVLEAVDGTRGHAQIADVVSRSIGKRAEADDIAYLVEKKLRPLGVLRSADGAAAPAPTSNPLLALRWRLVVSNPRITRLITAPFALLFKPWLAVPLLIAFATITSWLLLEKGLASAAHQALYEPALLLLVFGLTMLSAGFHEFGHAAACRYGGATPGVMGVGLYLVWPAFYTEVSDSYRLDRRGRLRVDVGGLYFNAIFAVAMFAAWSVTRWDALLLMIPAQVLQMLRQLLPFVRFDGYHILSDLTGVPDLFAHLKPTLLGLLPKRWRKPHPRPLKRWARWVVTTWVLLVIPVLLFSLFMMITVMPRVMATVWDSLGMQYAGLREHWAAGAFADAGVRVLSMGAIALPAASMTYLLWRIASRTTRRVWRATADRPLRRAAAVAVGIALLGLLVWYWWPDGQYKPIEADERGSLLDVIPPVPPQTLVAAHAAGQSWPSVVATPAPGIREISGPMLVPAGAAPEPQLAMVLTPESGTAPEQIILLPPSEDLGFTPTTRSEWPFPFNRVREARPQDNQALAVNTVDGTTVYDVALALVWVQDGKDVDERNDAYALASCRDCTTVAVAFQVILVLGQSDIIVPQNIAIAVNYECHTCLTYALAVQLIATLNDTPTAGAMAQIDAIWAQLETWAETIEDVPLNELHYRLAMVEAAILQVLVTDDGVNATSSTSEQGNVDSPPTTDTTEQPGSATTEAATESATTDAAATESDATSEPAATSEPPASSEPAAQETEAITEPSTTTEQPVQSEPPPTTDPAPEETSTATEETSTATASEPPP